MKRLITTLAILLVVIVVGMTALVMLVNPNDFRQYMAQQVAKRSGYQLSISGDLRWHVWPRLSILSEQVSLTAPGAAVPAVTAENMRLDVELLPLLSHQLNVSQVMLKNAVIRDIPEATGQKKAGAPVAPQDGENLSSVTRGWSFAIRQLTLADSLFIWQDAQGNQINFRDLNLSLTQDNIRQGEFTFSSKVSRNQQNLTLNIDGYLDATHYPQQLNLDVRQGNYQISGVDLPAEGISGQAVFKASWQPAGEQFSVTNLALHANDSDFSGNVSGKLSPSLALQAAFNSQNADFDRLLAPTVSHDNTTNTRQAKAPVIADSDSQPIQDSWLRNATMAVSIHAGTAQWRGMQLKQLELSAYNSDGITHLQTLSGGLGNGQFSLPGQLDWRGNQTQVNLAPVLTNIDLQPVLAFLQLPPVVKGEVSLQGQFTGNGLSHADISRQWQGSGKLTLNHAQTASLNLQQMVSDTVARNSGRVRYSAPNNNTLPMLTGSFRLEPGVLSFTDLQGQSSDVRTHAQGQINLTQRTLDTTFNFAMTGWQGDPKLVKQLSELAIPVRLYGPWDHLQYSLPVAEILNDSLRQRMKKRLDKWLDAPAPEPHR